MSHLTFKGLLSNASKKNSFHNFQLACALLNLGLHEVDSGGFSFVHFRLWNYLLTYYLLYSSKFLKISVKSFQVFYIKYIIYLRVFSTGKSLRINYYTAEKAKSVDCIKSVSCLFDKFAQVRSRSSVVLKRMFSQIFRNLQKSPFVRALSPTTKDCDLQPYLKEILIQVFSCQFCSIFKYSSFPGHIFSYLGFLSGTFTIHGH